MAVDATPGRCAVTVASNTSRVPARSATLRAICGTRRRRMRDSAPTSRRRPERRRVAVEEFGRPAGTLRFVYSWSDGSRACGSCRRHDRWGVGRGRRSLKCRRRCGPVTGTAHPTDGGCRYARARDTLGSSGRPAPVAVALLPGCRWMWSRRGSPQTCSDIEAVDDGRRYSLSGRAGWADLVGNDKAVVGVAAGARNIGSMRWA